MDYIDEPVRISDKFDLLQAENDELKAKLDNAARMIAELRCRNDLLLADNRADDAMLTADRRLRIRAEENARVVKQICDQRVRAIENTYRVFTIWACIVVGAFSIIITLLCAGWRM